MAWIKSSEFVEMVMHDYIFIIEFIRRGDNIGLGKIGDPFIDESCLTGQ